MAKLDRRARNSALSNGSRLEDRISFATSIEPLSTPSENGRAAEAQRARVNVPALIERLAMIRTLDSTLVFRDSVRSLQNDLITQRSQGRQPIIESPSGVDEKIDGFYVNEQ